MPRYTNRQQLISTRTIADIAKQVHEAEIVKLIHRLYLFGEYNPNTNLWEALGGGDTSLVDWDANAKIVDVMKILKLDNATRPWVPLPTDNPDTSRNESKQASFDGPNLISPQFSMNGHRDSDIVKIYGLSALVRLSVVRTGASIYTDKVTFRFGFYRWTKITDDGHLVNDDQPAISTLIPWKPFGYSATIDSIAAPLGSAQGQGLPYATTNLNMLMNSEKVKTLVEKEVTLNVSSIQGSVNMRTIRLYKALDMEPLLYDPQTKTGYDTLNYKVFFAIKSNLPEIITDFIEPRCQACVKVHYTNVH